jgi:hypothetical protein
MMRGGCGRHPRAILNKRRGIARDGWNQARLRVLRRTPCSTHAWGERATGRVWRLRPSSSRHPQHAQRQCEGWVESGASWGSVAARRAQLTQGGRASDGAGLEDDRRLQGRRLHPRPEACCMHTSKQICTRTLIRPLLKHPRHAQAIYLVPHVISSSARMFESCTLSSVYIQMYLR